VDHLQGVAQELLGFTEELQGSNPTLYRDLALYLQVLRDGLLNAVQQACFHLATRFYPERYCAMGAQQRAELQERLSLLVMRSSSLLTVEQLAQLAGELVRERQLQRHQRQQEWLAQLHKLGEEDSEAEQPADPDGSVQLQVALPIDPQRWLALGGAPAMHPQAQELDGAGLEDLLNDSGESLLDALGDPADVGALPEPWDTPCLPVDPQALLAWLEGFERALQRLLRNLSHALNRELLRLGLSRSLLPPSLLQAALQGQLEPQPAPANLLRLPLPLSPESGAELDSVALLLRPADLELDQPRLRHCRSRLQRRRQEIRRMAEQHRRVQRRLQTLEAERLWHQDTSRPAQDPPPP
jgi:hypothetical protein